MKFSAKSRYALKLALDLAEHKNDGVTSLSDISARQDISKKYLEQIVPMLIKAGIVNAVRSANGGYNLIKSPENESDIKVEFVWREIYSVMEQCINGISMQDILDHNANFWDYCI